MATSSSGNPARRKGEEVVKGKERGKEKKEEGERRNDRSGRKKKKKTFFPGKIKQQVIRRLLETASESDQARAGRKQRTTKTKRKAI